MPDGTVLTPAQRAEMEVEVAVTGKSPFPVHMHDQPAAARMVGPVLATQGDVYERGGPVRVLAQPSALPKIVPQNEHGIIALLHRTHQPETYDVKGVRKPITLPRPVVQQYLGAGDLGLLPLDGTSMTPLASADGTIRARDGYDPTTRLWCLAVPELHVPDDPSDAEARDALRRCRAATATLPYADAVRVTVDGEEQVDLSQPPGAAESAYLAAQMTAVLRSSLRQAPAYAITAPSGNGRGSGKTKAACYISVCAFGIEPPAVTSPPGDREELEKRITAKLREGAPFALFDNINDTTFRSLLMQTAITPGLIEVRPFGRNDALVPVRVTAMIVLTGNGLVIGDDLTRRILPIPFDPRREDAETRRFKRDLLDGALERRPEFLADWLTIFRWGCRNRHRSRPGIPFGFPEWERMVRDPLLALGCQDPVAAAQQAKALDPEARAKAELFQAWDLHHGDKPVTAATLAPGVEELLNPQARSRQWVATKLARLAGSIVAGFKLEAGGNGRWSAATYTLRRVDGGAPPPPAEPPLPRPRTRAEFRDAWGGSGPKREEIIRTAARDAVAGRDHRRSNR